MMTRKFLFVVFTNEPCKRNHAFMYALDLLRQGHEVRILLEGEATRCLAEREGHFGEMFATAQKNGILLGACKTASGGCSTDDAARNVTSIALEQGISLLGEMNGHPSIREYVAEGFELVMM